MHTLRVKETKLTSGNHFIVDFEKVKKKVEKKSKYDRQIKLLLDIRELHAGCSFVAWTTRFDDSNLFAGTKTTTVCDQQEY